VEFVALFLESLIHLSVVAAPQAVIEIEKRYGVMFYNYAKGEANPEEFGVAMAAQFVP
jgi:hypothetical protein